MQSSNMVVGQYYPGHSILHSVDPRSKIIAACAFVIALFMVNGFGGLVIMGAGLAAAIALAGIPLPWLWRGLKPVLFLLVITIAFQLFLSSGEELWRLGPVHIYRNGLVQGAFLTARLLLLVLSGSILTFSTPPVLLTDALGRLMAPLAKLKIPTYDLALMMTIALRFIPTLVMEVDRIIKAQKARGAVTTGGGLLVRARGMMPVLVPLFVMSFRHADELALAMESRCWRGGRGRTIRRKLAFSKKDAVFAIAVLAVLSASLWMGRFR